jgi:hypothetical protein
MLMPPEAGKGADLQAFADINRDSTMCPRTPENRGVAGSIPALAIAESRMAAAFADCGPTSRSALTTL